MGALWASSFLPEHFWLLATVYLGGCALLVAFVFWITAQRGGTRLWVVVGIAAGAVLAVQLSVGLLPAGAALGSAGGWLIGRLLSRFFT